MAVKSSDLDSPEQDLDLVNREARGAKRGADEALRARVAAARDIKPDDLHCSHCVQAFAAGRDAALKLIEG